MTRPDDQQTALLPPMKWNAWGDPAEAKPLSDGIRSLLKQALGVEESTAAELDAEQVRLRPSALSDTDRDGLAAIVGADFCRVDDHGRLMRAGGKSTLDLLRRRDSGVQDAPDAVLLPRRRRRDRGDPAVLRRPRHRDRPVRRRHQRGRRPGPHPRRLQRRGLAGSAPAERTARPRRGLRRSRTRRRSHRPGGRTPARRTRLLARPLPAELPVRDHRRIRRHPVVRPGLRGLRPLQRHGPRAAHSHPGGRARPGPRPGVGRRPGPASTADRLGGRVRDHHPRAGPGAPRPGGHPLRGVVVPRLRDRRRRTARRRADRHRADRRSGCPTRPRRA